MYLRMDKEKHEEIMKQIHAYKLTRPKIIANLEGEISDLRWGANLSLPEICTVLKEDLDFEISPKNLSTILRRLEGMEKNYFLRLLKKNPPKLAFRRKKNPKPDDDDNDELSGDGSVQDS